MKTAPFSIKKWPIIERKNPNGDFYHKWFLSYFHTHIQISPGNESWTGYIFCCALVLHKIKKYILIFMFIVLLSMSCCYGNFCVFLLIIYMRQLKKNVKEEECNCLKYFDKNTKYICVFFRRGSIYVICYEYKVGPCKHKNINYLKLLPLNGKKGFRRSKRKLVKQTK